ncbi:Uncharacterised protein [Mycolicibacterium vanbaalenii]|uniref:Uncharacterized protein n=1 Tax=Mycolicibacterium vanbaalenii TaxID=110539 RepID=A0A5S9R8D3_MYCVN|nr:hypothetical protein [Mycolicibacterium vanbaalenii]CAA0136101.1 Uncharacterised protein [Mycolicibacterium vanbaalenii]
MGFVDDFGPSKDERERVARETAEIARKGAEEVAAINAQTRESARSHSEYRQWQSRHNRWDITFEDWVPGRYVHVVVNTNDWP